MNILIKKFQDVGIQVNLKPEGFYDCQILRANGLVEKPWDKPQKNAINPTGKDYLLRITTPTAYTGLAAPGRRFLELMFGTGIHMVLGANDGPPSSYDQANLWTHPMDRVVNDYVTHAQNKYSGAGNLATVNNITGNAIITASFTFDPAEAPQTIREVAFGGSNAWGGAWGGATSNIRLSRTVLDLPIVLNQGDILTMTYTLVIPTPAVTPLDISLPSQNGLNLSGQLKLVGSIDEMIGGTVTAGGVLGGSATTTAHSTAGGGCIYPSYPRWAMSTDAVFPQFNINTTASAYGVKIADTNTFLAYSDGSHNRTFAGQFNPGERTFRSLYLLQGNVKAAYQLLLDSEQTTDSAKTLVVGLNFAL